MDNDNDYDYATRFIEEVHNNLQTPEVPKRRSVKKVLIILGIIVALTAIVAGAVILVNNIIEDQRLARFKDEEMKMIEKTEAMIADPIFSLIPYSDDTGGFTVDAWGIDDDIIVKILPSCVPEHYDEYLQNAMDWLDRQIGDLSGYIVEIDQCKKL